VYSKIPQKLGSIDFGKSFENSREVPDEAEKNPAESYQGIAENLRFIK
jgi:hypothetical protein